MVAKFEYQLCHMTSKDRRKKYRTKRISEMRKNSTRCGPGKMPKCSRTKGLAYCGKKTRRSKK